jgi:ubiquinone/menaquinone biosynthesis C-methylase UbiE
MSHQDITRQGAWEESYKNKQNFVFYPNEEMVRFISKYIRKRTGFSSFEDHLPNAAGMKLLDVGCGIGRHLVMAQDFELDPHGFDLSAEAIRTAREWLRSRGLQNAEEKIVQSDARALPWRDTYFDVAVSHGVLDSMPFDIAKSAISEVQRTLKPESLFYCDLIGGGNQEEVVSTFHEKDTIQSYFDEEKIDELFSDRFDIVEKILVDRHDKTDDCTFSRWHIITRRRKA